MLYLGHGRDLGPVRQLTQASGVHADAAILLTISNWTAPTPPANCVTRGKAVLRMGCPRRRLHSLARGLATCQNDRSEVCPRLCSAHFNPGRRRGSKR